MNLLELPHDILVNITWLVGKGNLLHYAPTCFALNRVSNDDSLWRRWYMSDWGQDGNEGNGGRGWKVKYFTRRMVRAKEVQTFNELPTIIPGLAELKSPPHCAESFIIQFLQDKDISRVARGIYLSFTDTRTTGVLAAYFNTFDFFNKTVLESLSHLVSYVQFPSHFSVITKFMLYFAERYHTCNPGSIFKNADAVYVLAFGIIMLNTDMHNPAVKKKMTLQQYIHNCSGINNGTDLPENLLVDIFNKVRDQPLVFSKINTPNQIDSSLWSWVSDWIGKLKR